MTCVVSHARPNFRSTHADPEIDETGEVLDLLSSPPFDPSARPGQEAAAHAWSWPRLPRPSIWIPQHIFLPPGVSHVPGRLSFVGRPYMIPVVDSIIQPGRRIIALLAGSQQGKSLTCAGLSAWAGKHRPGSIFWMREDEKSVNEFWALKLSKIYHSSPALLDIMQAGRGSKSHGIQFVNGAALTLGHAGSPTAAQGRDPWLIFSDEHEKSIKKNPHLGDLLSRLEKRILTHRSLGRIFIPSTPFEEDAGMWQIWKNAHQEMWFVECPLCHTHHPIEFSYDQGEAGDEEDEKIRRGGVRWPRLEDGSHPDPMRLKASGDAYWECPTCEFRVTEAAKQGFINAGQMLSVTPDRTLDLSAFRIPGLVSPDYTWSAIAAEFVAALKSPAKMVTFRTEVQVLPARDTRSRVRISTLEALAKDTGFRMFRDHPPRGPRNIPEVPNDVERIYFAADAQKIEFWGNLVGMGYEGRARLLWAGRIDSKEDIRALDLATWRRQDGTLLYLSKGGIDTNDGNRTEELYQFIRTLTNFVPLRGKRNTTKPIVFGNQDVKDPRTGKVQDLALVVHTWWTTFFQDALQTALDLGPGDGPRGISLPIDTPREWFEHIRNEVRKEILVDGHPTMVWTPVTRNAPQHLRDSMCMALVLAMLDDGWIYKERLPDLNETDEEEILRIMQGK